MTVGLGSSGEDELTLPGVRLRGIGDELISFADNTIVQRDPATGAELSSKTLSLRLMQGIWPTERHVFYGNDALYWAVEQRTGNKIDILRVGLDGSFKQLTTVELLEGETGLVIDDDQEFVAIALTGSTPPVGFTIKHVLVYNTLTETLEDLEVNLYIPLSTADAGYGFQIGRHALVPQQCLQRFSGRYACPQYEISQRNHDVQVLVGPRMMLQVMLVQEREPSHTLKPSLVRHVHAIVKVLVTDLVERQRREHPYRYRQAHKHRNGNQNRHMRQYGEGHSPHSKLDVLTGSVTHKIGGVGAVDAVMHLSVAVVEVPKFCQWPVHECAVDDPFCKGGVNDCRRERSNPNDDGFKHCKCSSIRS